MLAGRLRRPSKEACPRTRRLSPSESLPLERRSRNSLKNNRDNRATVTNAPQQRSQRHGWVTFVTVGKSPTVIKLVCHRRKVSHCHQTGLSPSESLPLVCHRRKVSHWFVTVGKSPTGLSPVILVPFSGDLFSFSTVPLPGFTGKLLHVWT